MALLPILTTPDPRLKYGAERVTDFDKVQPFIGDMLDTLYSTANGIG